VQIVKVRIKGLKIITGGRTIMIAVERTGVLGRS
jgi:hypothetical protein